MLCDAVDWADVMVEYKCLELFEVSGSNSNIVRLEEVSKEELEVAERDERCYQISNNDVRSTPRPSRELCVSSVMRYSENASTRPQLAHRSTRLSSAQAGFR
jgi:hypothetical protein